MDKCRYIYLFVVLVLGGGAFIDANGQAADMRSPKPVFTHCGWLDNNTKVIKHDEISDKKSAFPKFEPGETVSLEYRLGESIGYSKKQGQITAKLSVVLWHKTSDQVLTKKAKLTGGLARDNGQYHWICDSDDTSWLEPHNLPEVRIDLRHVSADKTRWIDWAQRYGNSDTPLIKPQKVSLNTVNHIPPGSKWTEILTIDSDGKKRTGLIPKHWSFCDSTGRCQSAELHGEWGGDNNKQWLVLWPTKNNELRSSVKIILPRDIPRPDLGGRDCKYINSQEMEGSTRINYEWSCKSDSLNSLKLKSQDYFQLTAGDLTNCKDLNSEEKESIQKLQAFSQSKFMTEARKVSSKIKSCHIQNRIRKSPPFRVNETINASSTNQREYSLGQLSPYFRAWPKLFNGERLTGANLSVRYCTTPCADVTQWQVARILTESGNTYLRYPRIESDDIKFKVKWSIGGEEYRPINSAIMSFHELTATGGITVDTLTPTWFDNLLPDWVQNRVAQNDRVIISGDVSTFTCTNNALRWICTGSLPPRGAFSMETAQGNIYFSGEYDHRELKNTLTQRVAIYVQNSLENSDWFLTGGLATSGCDIKGVLLHCSSTPNTDGSIKILDDSMGREKSEIEVAWSNGNHTSTLHHYYYIRGADNQVSLSMAGLDCVATGDLYRCKMSANMDWRNVTLGVAGNAVRPLGVETWAAGTVKELYEIINWPIVYLDSKNNESDNPGIWGADAEIFKYATSTCTGDAIVATVSYEKVLSLMIRKYDRALALDSACIILDKERYNSKERRFEVIIPDVPKVYSLPALPQVLLSDGVSSRISFEAAHSFDKCTWKPANGNHLVCRKSIAISESGVADGYLRWRDRDSGRILFEMHSFGSGVDSASWKIFYTYNIAIPLPKGTRVQFGEDTCLEKVPSTRSNVTQYFQCLSTEKATVDSPIMLKVGNTSVKNITEWKLLDLVEIDEEMVYLPLAWKSIQKIPKLFGIKGKLEIFNAKKCGRTPGDVLYIGNGFEQTKDNGLIDYSLTTYNQAIKEEKECGTAEDCLRWRTLSRLKLIPDNLDDPKEIALLVKSGSSVRIIHDKGMTRTPCYRVNLRNVNRDGVVPIKYEDESIVGSEEKQRLILIDTSSKFKDHSEPLKKAISGFNSRLDGFQTVLVLLDKVSSANHQASEDGLVNEWVNMYGFIDHHKYVNNPSKHILQWAKKWLHMIQALKPDDQIMLLIDNGWKSKPPLEDLLLLEHELDGRELTVYLVGGRGQECEALGENWHLDRKPLNLTCQVFKPEGMADLINGDGQ